MLKKSGCKQMAFVAVMLQAIGEERLEMFLTMGTGDLRSKR